MSIRQILIIEDDESIRELLTEFLQHEGYVVQQAENGFHALEVLSKMKYLPDLVLLDIMMPVMDGIKFYEHVSQDVRYCDLKIIMMSANPGLVSKEIRDQVKAFLIKPINLNVLLRLIDIKGEVQTASEAAC